MGDPILDAQLDAVLQADPETVEQVRSAFRIDTLAQADWAARKVERAHRRLAEAREVVEAHNPVTLGMSLPEHEGCVAKSDRIGVRKPMAMPWSERVPLAAGRQDPVEF